MRQHLGSPGQGRTTTPRDVTPKPSLSRSTWDLLLVPPKDQPGKPALRKLGEAEQAGRKITGKDWREDKLKITNTPK